MLKSMKELRGFRIGATDAELGNVDDAYFDDERWTVRYLVADVGHWLSGRKVLISPHAIARIDSSRETVDTRLTRSQVESSPPIETDQPISRRMEAEYNRYYRYPPYWGTGYTTGLWGLGALPLAGMEPILHAMRFNAMRKRLPRRPKRARCTCEAVAKSRGITSRQATAASATSRTSCSRKATGPSAISSSTHAIGGRVAACSCLPSMSTK
jgi:hypothetical protein